MVSFLFVGFIGRFLRGNNNEGLGYRFFQGVVCCAPGWPSDPCGCFSCPRMPAGIQWPVVNVSMREK